MPQASCVPATPPGKPSRYRLLKLLLLLVLAACAGWMFEHVGAPLPWMIGPLLLTSAVFMGLSPGFTVPDRLRPVGQIVVATQVGLAFSPAALGMLAELAPVIVATALATGICVFLVALITARLTGQNLAQCFLSAAPTSPVEAASMASAAGLDPVPVIFSQTLRLAAVVLVVPFALYSIEGWPEVDRPPVTLDLGNPYELLLLAMLGISGAWLFRRLGVPNPNFLGPMTGAAMLSVSGFVIHPYPPLVLALAQIVLGTWLGASFRRDTFSSALRLSLSSLASTLLLLLLCSLCAVGIAALSGVNWKTVVLGAAPGGAVEMALTAKFLGANVVLITTFHIVRIFLFMPSIPWIVKAILRYERRG